MALIATVSKTSVTKVQAGLWTINLNMVLTDDVDVLNMDYSVYYRPGDSIATKEAMFTSMMQADIDKYKSEQTIYNSAALDTAVTNVEAALET